MPPQATGGLGVPSLNHHTQQLLCAFFSPAAGF